MKRLLIAQCSPLLSRSLRRRGTPSPRRGRRNSNRAKPTANASTATSRLASSTSGRNVASPDTIAEEALLACRAEERALAAFAEELMMRVSTPSRFLTNQATIRLARKGSKAAFFLPATVAMTSNIITLIMSAPRSSRCFMSRAGRRELIAGAWWDHGVGQF
jgi:hypothetical protein